MCHCASQHAAWQHLNGQSGHTASGQGSDQHVAATQCGCRHGTSLDLKGNGSREPCSRLNPKRSESHAVLQPRMVGWCFAAHPASDSLLLQIGCGIRAGRHLQPTWLTALHSTALHQAGTVTAGWAWACLCVPDETGTPKPAARLGACDVMLVAGTALQPSRLQMQLRGLQTKALNLWPPGPAWLIQVL